MSDAIDALNKVIYLTAQREGDAEGQPAPELVELLEKIAVVAGDALEDHVAARNRVKPRKQRVFKMCVEEIASIVGDDPDTPEAIYHAMECIQEVLDNYKLSERRLRA